MYVALNIYLSGTSHETTETQGFGSLIEQFAWYGIYELTQHPLLPPTHQPVFSELQNIEAVSKIFQKAYDENHISLKALCYNMHVEIIALKAIKTALGQSVDTAEQTTIPDKYITEAILRYKKHLSTAFSIDGMHSDAVDFLQKFLLYLYNLSLALKKRRMYKLAVFVIEEALAQVWSPTDFSCVRNVCLRMYLCRP